MKLYIYIQLTLLSWGSFYSLSFGQQNDNFKTLISLLQAYTNEHVVPLMQIQRTKLDQFLSSSDLNNLHELQIEYAKLEKRKQVLLNGFMGSDKAWLKEWDYIENAQGDISLEIQNLAEKYTNIIQKLLNEEVAEFKQIWRSDMNEIVAQYNLQPSTTWAFKKHGFGDFMQAEGFLLWQISPPPTFEREAAAETGLSNSNVLKNSRSIEFTVQEAGEVTISLLNGQGKVVKTIFKDYLEAGFHRLHLPQVDPVFSARYCKIESKSGTQIQKYPFD